MVLRGRLRGRVGRRRDRFLGRARPLGWAFFMSDVFQVIESLVERSSTGVRLIRRERIERTKCARRAKTRDGFRSSPRGRQI